MNWRRLIDRLTDRVSNILSDISNLLPQDDFDTEDQLASA
jgi:hypothetical protein